MPLFCITHTLPVTGFPHARAVSSQMNSTLREEKLLPWLLFLYREAQFKVFLFFTIHTLTQYTHMRPIQDITCLDNHCLFWPGNRIFTHRRMTGWPQSTLRLLHLKKKCSRVQFYADLTAHHNCYWLGHTNHWQRHKHTSKSLTLTCQQFSTQLTLGQ